MCVPCPGCPVCLCSRVEFVASGAAGAPETHAAAPGSHAPVPMHAFEHAAGGMRHWSALRRRAFRWHFCACVQILSGLLKRIPLEKRPKRAKYRHLLKAPDLNSGTGHAEVFACVSGQDVVGS